MFRPHFRLHAQAARARAVVTVVDQSGAVVPDATVTLVGLEDATKAVAIQPAKTSDKGIATIENVAPGRYSIQAEFPGFELGLLRDVRLRSGDNKHVVVLPIKKVETEVTVGRDAQAVAADPRARFGTALTREQIEALSDDPAEMQQQLADMAGPNAILRVDSFEGLAAAAEVADQVDSHHARCVRGGESFRRRPVHRHHHAAGCRRRFAATATSDCATVR